MLTFADGFSGFGGAKIGAMAAGLQPLWSNEKDPEIARVHQTNFPDDRMIVDDFLNLDPCYLPAPDVMHWSPPCINASVAKQADENGVRESELDREFSRKIIKFTEVHHSKVITLENVWGYRNFQAFQGGEDCEGLIPALWRLGYHVRWWHLNAADYGVPQTRKRLIMIAARDFIPQRPIATHQDPKEMNGNQIDMFSPLKPWVGWYKAIEDLIPTLPPSQFAPWQLARLPEEFKDFMVNPNRSSLEWSTENDIGEIDRPMFSIMAQNGLEKYRAFIAAQGKYDDKLPISTGDNPVLTVTANSNQTGIKAFIIPGDNASNETIRYGNEPTITVGNTKRVGNVPRAFIMDGDNQNNFGSEPTTRNGENPIFAITSNIHKGIPRAWLSQGRVVKMTARALARFQSFPDWYILPDKNALACKGLGNACPPLGMERIFKGLCNP